MAFTQRKLNRLKGWSKYNETLKKYSKQPVIKNVDVEELKKQFTSAAPEAPKSKKKEAAAEAPKAVASTAPEDTNGEQTLTAAATPVE